MYRQEILEDVENNFTITNFQESTWDSTSGQSLPQICRENLFSKMKRYNILFSHESIKFLKDDQPRPTIKDS